MRQAAPRRATFPPQGPPGDRRELRRVRVSVILARRLPRSGPPADPGALRAPLKPYRRSAQIRVRIGCAVPLDASQVKEQVRLDSGAGQGRRRRSRRVRVTVVVHRSAHRDPRSFPWRSRSPPAM